LLHAIDKKNLREELRKFAQDKLYVGISASSHITAADLALSTQQKVNEYREKYGYNADEALGWIDFYVRSHYRSENFPHIKKQYVAGLAQKLGKRIYAIDDDSAVKVIDKQVEVVSEGVYERFV
jgi:dipeptidase E